MKRKSRLFFFQFLSTNFPARDTYKDAMKSSSERATAVKTRDGERDRQPQKRRGENLGWLASGQSLPRKRKPIENVAHASLLFLEAEKARAKAEKEFSVHRDEGQREEQQQQQTGRGGRLKKIQSVKSARREGMHRENGGVKARNERDELERDEERKRRSVMLEKKARLYEKLSSRGRGCEEQDLEDDDGTVLLKAPKDGFDVDFRRKRREEEGEDEYVEEEYAYDFQNRFDGERYRGREDEEEREWNEYQDQRRREEEERKEQEYRDEERRERERRLVEDVARETEAARREAEEAKMETVEAREALKKKFIQEKIAQLKEKKRLEKEEKKKRKKEKMKEEEEEEGTK
jgi:hypothetical protein